MKFFLGFILWLGFLLPTTPLRADGSLKYIFKAKDYFFKIDITENNGIKSGKRYSSGVDLLSTYVYDNTFFMEINNRRDFLKMTDLHSSILQFQGTLWKPVLSSFEAITERGQLTAINGNVADISVRIRLEPEKKYFIMSWIEPKHEYTLELSGDPAHRGRCAGTLWDGIHDVAKLNCNSEGSLEDVFFKSSQDILAWLVHLMIIPE